MIRELSMVATLVAALGMPLAASASFMDDLPDACQAALLARRIVNSTVIENDSNAIGGYTIIR